MNERILVECTRDKMLGIVWFEEPENDGSKLTRTEIEVAIKNKGIVFGVDEDVLEEIFNHRVYNYKYIIARGIEPIPGEDAVLKYKIDVSALNDLKPKHNEDGTVNFKSLNIIQNIQEGQVLAIKAPATKGVDGCNVLGKVLIGKMGKDVRMPQGKNTQVSDDALTLIAAKQGRLSYSQGVLSIADVFIVQGDVDSSTGNIDFVGSVLINGTVKTGYSVKAQGNIEIHGGVEASEVISGEDLVVWYGIQGKDKGVIKANGNIIAKFIQNAEVEAQKDIITEVIMHSSVAATNVKCKDGKGLIVGGKIIATRSISASTIGSYMATHTDIQLGVLPEVIKRMSILKNECKEYTEKMQKIAQAIAYLAKKRDELKESKKATLTTLLATRQEVQTQLKQSTGQYNELVEKVNAVEKANVYVANVVYPGVKITIGSAIKYIREDTHYCTIQKNGLDIVINSFG